MKPFVIVGAGMAGLFAAAVLREKASAIFERQNELPHNHSALLRFRSSVVGDAVNVPFRKVRVMKAIHGPWPNAIYPMILYSRKTNGSATLRSAISARGEIEERFIAPPDFISQLAGKVQCPIYFGESWRAEDNSIPVISTMPLPMLANYLGYEIEEPKSVSGITLRAKLRNTDLCATIYTPGFGQPFYRVSITDDELIAEFATGVSQQWDEAIASRLTDEREEVAKEAADLFGISDFLDMDTISIHISSYAKILPMPENERKRFILWATEKHNIYSFGRFATWRPHLLMDDLVQDLQVIQRIAGGAGRYEGAKSL